MRKAFLLICSLIMLFTSIVFVGASAAEAYLVDLSIEFEENWFFSTYDVDLYVNKTEQATLVHGKDYACSFYVPAGQNTIFFYKQGNKGIKGTLDLNVTDNTTVFCHITCHSDEVTISKIRIQSTQPEANATRSLPDEFSAVPEQEAEELSTLPINQVISFADIDFSTFTDEELDLAAEAIKAEKRARMTTKIQLSNEEATIGKGKTLKLTGEVVDLPEGVTASKLTWSTSDKTIANIAQGTVTGVGPGTAVITCSATLSDGTELLSECQVTVIVPVSKITIAKQALTLGLKEPAIIAVTVSPANASDPRIEFTSSDPSVAIVSADGVITPVSTGTTIITATATDGSNASGKCTVKVTAKSELNIPRSTPDGMILTLTGVKTAKGNMLAKPESGNIFIIVDYVIENQSKSSETISYQDFEPYCNGYKLDVDNSLWVCDNYNYLDKLEPGRKLKGQFCIEAPADWKEIEIQFNKNSFWSSDSVSLMLYK